MFVCLEVCAIHKKIYSSTPFLPPHPVSTFSQLSLNAKCGIDLRFAMSVVWVEQQQKESYVFIQQFHYRLPLFQVRKDPELCSHIDKLVRPTIDYMLTLQFPSGNYPAVVGDTDDRLVHWCHGAPGWASMWALAYQVTE